MRETYSIYQLNRILLHAAITGDFGKVIWAIDNGATDLRSALIEAIWQGHLDIARLLAELGATNYNEAMAYAAYSNHMDIIELMLELGATNYDWAMAMAAEANHINIVQFMLDMGARDYNRALNVTGNQAIIELITKYAENKGKKKI